MTVTPCATQTCKHSTQVTPKLVHVSDVDNTSFDWKISKVRTLATFDITVHGNITLGVAVGPRRCIADQPSAKVDVIRAMHERVQLCQDAQTEFALLRESLAVSRINHILKVHGRTILTEETFDEVGQGSLERLFQGFTQDGAQQATLSAVQSRTGCKRPAYVARQAHQGALIVARPRIRDMIRDATMARLLSEQPLVARLDDLVDDASADFLDTLDDSETPTAHVYLKNAAQAAEEAWKQIVHGLSGSSIANATIAPTEQSDPPSQPEDDGSDITCVPARKGRLNAPQLQAQLFRLSDRTLLRRSENTLLAKGV